VTTLLVASTGGHLKELYHLHTRLSDVAGPFRWATFDTPQSRSLLDGETVDFVRYIGARDPTNVIRNIAATRRILQDSTINEVVSTGAAVALPFFGMARIMGLHCHYIESAARIDGPSMTGRLVSRIPGVHLYAQHPRWSCGKWGYSGSVFDLFERDGPARSRRRRVNKVVVTLGTFRGYGFPRLIRRLLKVLPPEAEVLWQTGDTDTSEFGISGYYAIPERDLLQAMREADVIVSHAGVGTALAAFEVGKCPLLVPRRLSLGEHVDDHQTQIASELGKRGLSVSIDADDLSYEDLLATSRNRIAIREEAPAFVTSNA
jgi:UDP-N-acetylglucosamine--N-acetylmuramyl-(pentapeptide) pyrophosphoryl-undecaprenol N-acetylglucosamine transferase